MTHTCPSACTHSVPGSKFNGADFRQALAGRVAQEVLFPVYRPPVVLSGSNAQFDIVGWVGFQITGSSGGGNSGTIYGSFTRFIAQGLQGKQARQPVRLRRPRRPTRPVDMDGSATLRVGFGLLPSEVDPASSHLLRALAIRAVTVRQPTPDNESAPGGRADSPPFRPGRITMSPTTAPIEFNGPAEDALRSTSSLAL